MPNQSNQMKLSSHLLLGLARVVPRGYWKLMSLAAQRDPALHDLPIPLQGTDLKLRADLRETVYAPLFLHGQIPHELGLDRLCKALMRQGERVFDIGANVGYTAVMFAETVGPDGHVLALEPEPGTFALLDRSLSGVRQVKLLNMAASGSEGVLTLYAPEFLDRASFTPVPGARQVDVPTTTLDKLVRDWGMPQFIKVDVEGHEPDVFSGADEVLARADRPIIVFEALEEAVLRGCTDLLGAKSGQQYRFRRITNSGRLVDLNSPDGTSDYIALPDWALERLPDFAAFKD